MAVSLGSVAVCVALPLVFDGPASTIFSADETAAIAVALGPGRYFLGPESLLVSGGDTLLVTVTGSRRLSPPRNPRVAGYTPMPEGAVFHILPGDGP